MIFVPKKIICGLCMNDDYSEKLSNTIKFPYCIMKIGDWNLNVITKVKKKKN